VRVNDKSHGQLRQFANLREKLPGCLSTEVAIRVGSYERIDDENSVVADHESRVALAIWFNRGPDVCSDLLQGEKGPGGLLRACGRCAKKENARNDEEQDGVCCILNCMHDRVLSASVLAVDQYPRLRWKVL